MAYIYKITNQINGKVYIGKTTNTIQERWREHKQDYKKEQCKNRPFYRAMSKYGSDNFIIEELEQCDISTLEEREIYWINYYRAYVGWNDCNGYNATLGGDGKIYCDYNWVYNLWLDGKTPKEIHAITNYDYGTIEKILSYKGIEKKTRKKRGSSTTYKKIKMIDLNTFEVIQEFSSITEAAEAINVKNGTGHISSVCQGKRKTAYGYKWEYSD